MLYMVTFTINIPQMLAYIYTIHGSYGSWLDNVNLGFANHTPVLFHMGIIFTSNSDNFFLGVTTPFFYSQGLVILG